MSGCHSKNNIRKYHKFRSVNEFEILGNLGKGGYSFVRLVKHKRTGKRYALKCAMKYKKGKDRSERTWQEIKVLSGLNNVNIVKLYGWFEDSENIYLVLEYLSGKDLSKYFEKDLPDKNLAKNIMIQLIEAVKYCHTNKIIHRDLKLENILIDNYLTIKLTDFGLCVHKDREDQSFYDEVGTARYTAPELLRGKGYDESVDVWGIGIILFMLLTGEYPFDGSDRKDIFRRIRKKRLIYKKYNLSDIEIQLLKRLLCKDPRYRIQLEDILDHEWFLENHSDTYSDDYSDDYSGGHSNDYSENNSESY